MIENVIYELTYSDEYLEDISKYQKFGQKIFLKKISTFLFELKENPTTGTGKPEPLKGFEERLVYSRRIDQKHRLVYEIFEEDKRVELLSAYGHYDDK